MVDELMEEAYRLYEEAELKVDIEISESIRLFRQAACNLLNSYLSIKGIDGGGDLVELYQECSRIVPDFEIIRPEIEYLAEANPEEVDGEELTDKANEIWDFIQGLLIENELELEE